MTLAEADILVALDHKAPGVVRADVLREAQHIIALARIATGRAA